MQHESEGDELFCEDFNGQNSIWSFYWILLMGLIKNMYSSSIMHLIIKQMCT
ncbi:MAG: hypothetical protein U9Q69_06385 [Nanoarchaeota archaeon]|nr:hypothetical protein [Nanoarchaeota archaeon]